MTLIGKTTLAALLVSMVGPTAFGQSAGQVPTVAVRGNLEWLEEANVASRRDGVIVHIEKTIGMEVKRGENIAFLEATMAELAAKKAEMVAADDSLLKMAEAEREVAAANMARAERLFRNAMKNMIPLEEYELKQAQFKVADAKIREETAKRAQAEQEVNMAHQAVAEHIVDAPFDGEVLEVLKYPGESVQAMESVVRLARTDRVRFHGYIPLEVAYRIQKGMVVDLSPVIEGAEIPVEQKRFRGRIVFISPELVISRREAEVAIKADIINNTDKELRVGNAANMIIYLTNDPSQIPPPPADMLQLPQEPAPAPPMIGRRDPAASPAAAQ